MHFVHHREENHWFNNIKENEWGKIKKKCQCFIHIPLSPDCQSTKKSLWKIKAYWLTFSVFQKLDKHAITDK